MQLDDSFDNVSKHLSLYGFMIFLGTNEEVHKCFDE